MALNLRQEIGRLLERKPMSRRHSPGASRKGLPSSIIWIVVIVVTIVVVGGFALSGLGGVSAARNGSQVDFTLNDFSGKAVHLSDYRGKTVLVNLWASWCPPCRAEMPDLISFYQAHQSQGFVLLAVNSEDTANSAQQFAQQEQMPFPVLYDPSGTVSRLMGSNGLPSTYVIDRNGNVRFEWTGQISPAILAQQVVPLLTP